MRGLIADDGAEALYFKAENLAQLIGDPLGIVAALRVERQPVGVSGRMA